MIKKLIIGGVLLLLIAILIISFLILPFLRRNNQDTEDAYNEYSQNGGFDFFKGKPDYLTNSYDYDRIIPGENSRYHYTDQNGNIISKTGIDVSYFQGDIDWNKVKADGIDFVIVRVGYRGYESGIINLDQNFETYMQGASEAGLELGVYFFSQAINIDEVVEEAQFVLEKVGDYNLTYPIIFDWEEPETSSARTHEVNTNELTDFCMEFCREIKDAGYEPMIYSNRHMTSKLLDLKALSSYPFWYAEYREKPVLDHNFTIWQYTHEGTVDGISTTVDLNISFPQSKPDESTLATDDENISTTDETTYN